ncbi:MAG: glycosyltransferase [Campylobacterales bacterium]|nr:glycosyltransferase [Campylobacterales bacterium]MBD3795415.1 glycosyltransferase [Campylobacterota bacterium]
MNLSSAHLPLVSVLIPLYNANRYISECLDSIICQTYKNLEVIIIDDGSTDNSLAIAREYETLHRHIKVYSQQNSGASAARNKAFAYAKGEYIQYIDADDCLHEDKIMVQMQNMLEEETATLCFGKCEYFYKDKKNILERDMEIYRQKQFDPCEFLYMMWLNAEAIPPLGYLMHRSLIEASGGWNEALSNNDDGEFFARVILASKNIIFVPKSISYYRTDTPGSLSKEISQRASLSYIRSIELYVQHVKQCKQDFMPALKTVFTRALIQLYPLDQEAADTLQKIKEKLGILGYRYPKKTVLYDLLFWLFGIKRTAQLQTMLKSVRYRIVTLKYFIQSRAK